MRKARLRAWSEALKGVPDSAFDVRRWEADPRTPQPFHRKAQAFLRGVAEHDKPPMATVSIPLSMAHSLGQEMGSQAARLVRRAAFWRRR